MRILSSLFVLFLGFFACESSVKNENIPVETVQEKTPEALSGSSYSSGIKSRRGDILQTLYLEALENDPKLKDLSEAFSLLNTKKTDSLNKVNNYLQQSSQYYQSASYYAGSIADSVVRSTTLSLLARHEEQYKKRIADITINKEKLEELNLLLEDYHRLLKIAVTLPMIENFQRNEMPESDGLKKLTEEHTKHMEKVKQKIN